MSADLIDFTIEEPDRLNDFCTPGRVLLLGVLGPGEGSYFSTGFVILPDLLVPDPDDPVAVDRAVSSVILNSGLVSVSQVQFPVLLLLRLRRSIDP